MRKSTSHYLSIFALISWQGGVSSSLVEEVAISANLDTESGNQQKQDNRKLKEKTIKGTRKLTEDYLRLQPEGTWSAWTNERRVPKKKESILYNRADGGVPRPLDILIDVQSPTSSPSSSPTQTISYVPGKLNFSQNGLLLSEGLQSRIIAKSAEKVQLVDGSSSSYGFHRSPDGAAVFADPDTGGWIYVSNSEAAYGDGGVGAISFNADGEVVGFKILQVGTSWNCSGGKTPWNTWVSCEEYWDGRIWQVDPKGLRPPEVTSISTDNLGYFESFAYDIRDFDTPRFFVTEDSEFGALRRYTPSDPNWDDPWSILHGEGTMDYLVLEPSGGNRWDRAGTFSWTTNFRIGQNSAIRFYQHTEGLDVYDNELFIVSKAQRSLFILDLDNNTYERHSTDSGLFDGQPDQMQRLIKNGPSNVESSNTFKANEAEEEPLLYFCEEVGTANGIHARDANGWFYTILESSQYGRETSGLAFSPDGKHMYFSYQSAGIIFDIWRDDGLRFYGKSLDVHYHEKPDVPDQERDMWA
ncbi:unnamed protein product [Cylindrotheca closterium]|uniref:Uncharacterized protein n=1 Tax=Cylindrotheca closterium TaxID=2856 RepID=A0AAD2FNF7_9STRA|nr:unnamed protein product [Cylindrotheca closterium]